MTFAECVVATTPLVLGYSSSLLFALLSLLFTQNNNKKCDGKFHSVLTINVCNECALPNATLTCLDCDGTPFGKLTVSNCGVCGGTNQSQCHKTAVPVAAIVGGAVGAAVAVTAAALALFFFLMARKNPNRYIQDVIDKTENVHTHNPLYESAQGEDQSSLCGQVVGAAALP